MTTVLPNDIMHRVIEYLYGNAKTLSACALVSSSWIPAVRYHRFGHVHVRQRTIIPFHTLLQGSPDLPPYVTNIRIFCNWRTVESMAALYGILSSLPNLRALSLSVQRSIADSNKAQCIFSALPKSLEHVQLGEIRLSAIGELIFLWSQLPHLRSFALNGPTTIHETTIPEEYMRRDVKLLRATEIHIPWEIPHFDVIADWLCSQNIPAQLRACSLTVTKSEHVAPAAKLLHQLGKTLRSLEFYLYNGERQALRGSDVLDACDLEQCTSLDELHLSWRIWDYRLDDETFPRICRIISQIHAPRIRILVFSLSAIFDPDNIERTLIQLATVAAALSHAAAFKDLERVVICLSDLLDRPIDENMYMSIRDVVKPFEARGLLTVQSNPWHIGQWTF